MRNFILNISSKSLIELSQIRKKWSFTFEIFMLQGFTHRYSLTLFEFKHFFQQLSSLKADTNKLLKSLFNIFSIFSHILELIEIFCLEQFSASKKKVEQTSNAKNITFFIIVLLVNHFRRNVSNRASNGSAT